MFTKLKIKVQKGMCISLVYTDFASKWNLTKETAKEALRQRGTPVEQFLWSFDTWLHDYAMAHACVNIFFGGYSLIGFIQTWFAHNVHGVTFREKKGSFVRIVKMGCMCAFQFQQMTTMWYTFLKVDDSLAYGGLCDHHSPRPHPSHHSLLIAPHDIV